MSEAHNRIAIKCKGGHKKEGTAGTAITPGMHIALAADGDLDPSPAAIGELSKGGMLIALEDALQGKLITEAYAVGDNVEYAVPLPGDEFNLLIKDGETIAIGDNIVQEGGGTGLFVEAAGTEAKYPFKALEALSPSGSNGYVKCEFQG